MKYSYLLKFTILLAVTLSLASCKSTVPTPSQTFKNESLEKTVFKMHNNSPQRASNSKSIHFVDLDLDGHMDLLVGGDERVDGFHIEWGDSTGNWSLQSGPNTSMQPKAFATSDVNHNGAIDILIGGEGDQKGLQIWELQHETSTWSLLSTPIEAGIYKAVKLADVNNDGWDDIIAARADNPIDGGVFVLLNDGQGGWITGVGPISKGVFTGLAIEDINGDGNLDIIASRRSGLGSKQGEERLWKQVGGIQIWYGDGSSRWQPEVLPVSSASESVTVADINNDNKLDIITGLYQQGITIWLNDGDEWNDVQVIDSGTWSNVRVGDLNANGHKELVATSSDGQGIRIWEWQRSSFASRKGLVPNFGSYLDLDLGDVLNNGTLSFAVSHASSGVEVWSHEAAKAEPLKTFTNKKSLGKLSLYFDSGSAALNDESLKEIDTWVKSLNIDLKNLHWEIQGRTDSRPIHSDLFPNNIALSRARANTVAAWLAEHGANQKLFHINALGDKSPLATGSDPQSLRKNRRVFVNTFLIESVRLPKTRRNINKQDLFHVSENKVFKTLDGTPEYKIGAGDELSITFWQGGKSETKKVVVQIDGTVSLPYQAALKVAGYTPREVDHMTTNILRTYERNPRVDVFVLKARSKFASIFGEVQSLTRQPTGPGSYALKGKESLVDFLSRAGGPTREANLNNVQIIRNGKTILLNLNRAIRQGDLSENAIIDDGDTIFLPSLAQSKQQVYVLGQVNKTGIVEFTGDISFLDAISKSGGLTPDAYLPDIRILRANREQPEILAVNFQRFLENGDLTQNLALVDKDIIIIPSRPIANWNKFIQSISPSVSLLLQPVSIAQQILTLRALSGQVQ